MSGKTHLAARIESSLGASVVSLDEINRTRGLPFGLEGRPEAEWGATLEAAIVRVTRLMHARRAIVVDDTLCYRWLRDRFRRLAADYGYSAILLYLATDGAVLAERRAALLGAGDRPVLSERSFAEHLSSFEDPADDEDPVRLPDPGAIRAWLAREAAHLGALDIAG